MKARPLVTEDWSAFNAAALRLAGQAAPAANPLREAEALRRRLIGWAVLAVGVGVLLWLAALAWSESRRVRVEADLPPLRIHPDDLARLGGAAPTASAAAKAAAQAATQAEQENRASQAGAASPPAVTTSYTVFQTIPFRHGKVVSGWRYASGGAAAPEYQYCYFEPTDKTSEILASVVLGTRPGAARDFGPEAASLRLTEEAWAAAAAACRWFRAPQEHNP